ncbi:MAG: hypothetical protein NTZ78_06080 [Candidatus Aureabacteria bacterium]|nr:hypothetical protein [Candidatus Auribacterota bacterium]
MKIILEMLGAMKKPLGQGPVEVEVAEGTSIRDFMVQKLKYDPSHIGLLSYFVNGAPAKPSAILPAACALKILMIIGGG